MRAQEGAIKRLRDGNLRFVQGVNGESIRADSAHRTRLASRQAPFAVVLGCSDSRVIPEIIFDQGLGDLFVIRIAGNIATPAIIGSVEYAVEQFETKLVVVLGHTQCGAVTASVRTAVSASAGVEEITRRIRSNIEFSEDSSSGAGEEERIGVAVRSNVRAVVKQLREGSTILNKRIYAAHLDIAGAEYSLESGVVEFL